MFDFWINNFSAFPVMKDASSHFKRFFVDSLSYDVCIIKKHYITSPRICLICLAATSSLGTRLLYLVWVPGFYILLGTRLLCIVWVPGCYGAVKRRSCHCFIQWHECIFVKILIYFCQDFNIFLSSLLLCL